jgi:hypothetical protein
MVKEQTDRGGGDRKRGGKKSQSNVDISENQADFFGVLVAFNTVHLKALSSKN